MVANDSGTVPAALTACRHDGSEINLHVSTRLPAESWELVKLIRKLRWIGMEKEAELLARALAGRLAISSSVVGLTDTD